MHGGAGIGPPTGLQPQDLAITILGAYGRAGDRPVWSGGMVRLLGDFGFSPGAARVALGRLARSGLLTRVRRGRQVYYEFSERLQHVFAEGDRRIFGLGSGDGVAGEWTVLWQAVPDERSVARRRLARRLRFLGFGTVQNGTWVSPHDRADEVATVLEDLGLEPYVGVIVGRPATGATLEALTAQAWDLDALEESYASFLAEIAPYRAARARAALSDAEAFVVRTQLVHRFRRFPSEDPGLPDELLRRHAARTRAIRAFHDVYDALGPAAQRHFDAAMAGRGP